MPKLRKDYKNVFDHYVDSSHIITINSYIITINSYNMCVYLRVVLILITLSQSEKVLYLFNMSEKGVVRFASAEPHKIFRRR